MPRPAIGRRVVVRLPDALDDAVKGRAALLGVPVAEYLRAVLAAAHPEAQQ